jgi:hypothetical protein
MSMTSEQRYKDAVIRNITNMIKVKSHKAKSLESLKHILGIRKNDSTHDIELKNYLA